MDNKYSVYRQIRFNRTYRTLGKMTWWRVALGAVLLASVFLISGVVSQRFAARGNFILAEKLMVSPTWMEKHKPETKSFIEAGVLYQNGDYEAASEAFAIIKDVDAAAVMKSSSDVKLAAMYIADENYEKAYEVIVEVDYGLLSEELVPEYCEICRVLYQFYETNNDGQRIDKLSHLIENCSGS